MVRIVIYGAGRGGEVVAEMLSSDSKVTVVGFVDDNSRLWKQQIVGYTLLGGRDVLEELKSAGRFDALVLSMATPTTTHIRRRLYLELKSAGFEFANVIHPAAIISPSARLGENNVISAGTVISTGACIGDNNRISSLCNIEHHSSVGSHNFFGSHFVSGGAVSIGNDCVFGLNSCVESLLHIGNDVHVNSGALVLVDVPDGSKINA
jgi:sugar O-acyltransferase (sialic acid O-acetyltransferase NeuD family)